MRPIKRGWRAIYVDIYPHVLPNTQTGREKRSGINHSLGAFKIVILAGGNSVSSFGVAGGSVGV